VRTSLGAGDSFGEMALIDEGPRTATVVAATDLRCLALSPWDFRPFVEEHPKVAWSMLQTLARRLRELEAQAG
jgi:CRP/FNR family transcriptional regulator